MRNIIQKSKIFSFWFSVLERKKEKKKRDREKKKRERERETNKLKLRNLPSLPSLPRSSPLKKKKITKKLKSESVLKISKQRILRIDFLIFRTFFGRDKVE